MRVHVLTDTEIDAIASIGNSIDLTFLGISGGGFISLFVTVLTVQIQSSKEFAAFVLATAGAGLFTLFFAVRSIFSYKTQRRKLTEIKTASSRMKP